MHTGKHMTASMNVEIPRVDGKLIDRAKQLVEILRMRHFPTSFWI